ncbi:putative membrane protein YkoI [Alkalibaculum bacchi]|uniref:Putative membrane protein YkoI n=1 Tax=Alkalibaculum bacchi TaxID=645887 RepID=A0A366I8C4_9FIRM|nr:PepSY domain-containing protein [Alkalibaculum bacchi]RBP64390.1 putative membrane protein YkoI [Alkalibaculum bacchi]
MKNKKNKVLIPILATTILVGGGLGIAYATNPQDKPISVAIEENQTKQVKLTEKGATKIALEKVPGTIKEVELEDEDGTIVYEFEILSTDGTQKDVKVDAQTGKVIKLEADNEENEEEKDEEENQAKLAKQTKITEEEATKTALKELPGTVKEVELENEDGTIVYEFEILSTDGTQNEVKVDAQTGKIVRVEADDEDHSEKENNTQNQVEKVK